MERLLKKQIDDLLEYSLALKNMFVRLAQSEAFPDEITEEDKQELNNILYVMDAALEIEKKKVSKIHVCTSDLDAIEGYLLRFHEFTAYEDFVYENNELERLRVYNKLLHKYLMERQDNGTASKEELISNSFTRAIDSNFVYVLNEHMKNPEVVNLYSFFKYGRIFISPTYDSIFFPQQRVDNIKPITYYPVLGRNDLTNDLIKYGLQEIRKEFNGVIDTLYNGFTNEALEDEENEVRAVSMGMTLIAFLSTSFDIKFIDERYIEYWNRKKEDEEYTDVNDMIKSSLEQSKKIVLEQKEKRN